MGNPATMRDEPNSRSPVSTGNQGTTKAMAIRASRRLLLNGSEIIDRSPPRIARRGRRVDAAAGDIGEGAIDEVDGFVDFCLGEGERGRQLQDIGVDADV